MKQVGTGCLKTAVIAAIMGMAACLSRAADSDWVGITSGIWNSAANWKDGNIALGTGATAFFTNGVGVTVTQDISGLTLGGMTVANASYVYTNNVIAFTNAANAAAVVRVDGTNTAKCTLQLKSSGELIKEGTGTLTLNANSQNIKGPLTLNGGTVFLDTGVGGDGFHTLNGTITINSGATLKYGSWNQIGNDNIEIKAGGILDMNNKNDIIAGFFGAGVISNMSNIAWEYLGVNGQSRVFSGIGYGLGRIDSNGSPFILGTQGCLSNVIFRLSGSNQLGFLPGVNTFTIGGLTGTVSAVLALQATNGTPVALTLGSRADDTSINPFLGRITGPGSLTKIGASTLTLAGTCTYAGTTTVSNGTLKLGLANAITNTGAINVAGGTYDLGGFTVTNGAVAISAGTVANGTLFGSSYTCTDAGIFSAGLAGSAALSKGGPGTLALRGAKTFTGTVTVSGGTVEVQASPAVGSAVWLDAATLSSMAKNTDGTGGTPAQGDGVGRWISLSGSNWVSSATKPTYQTNVLNGLPVLRFASAMPFMSNVVAQGSTVFIVYKQTGSLGNWLQPLDSQGQTPTSGWLHMINNSNLRCLTRGGGAVNVASTFPSTNWAVQAVQIQTNDYRLWINESAYGPSTATNQFTAFTQLGIPGDFAEVLIYTNLLSTSDRTTTISYLQKKWLGVSGTSAATNNLSPSVAAEVKAGAVLDLCGGSQALAALSGGGTVTGGTVTVTSRLTPGDSGAAAGVLTLGGNLTLAAGATNAFDYVSATADTVSVAGTLTLQGVNTVELALNGQPPPAQMTLFTFSSLVGEGYLTAWTVQGAGLGPYTTRVKRVGNSIVLSAFLNGTLFRVQ